MISRKLTLVAGAALAMLALVSIMGPTGGFPSRPRFQSVGIGVANTTTGTLRVSGTPGPSGQVRLNGDATGASNVAYVAFADSANTRIGYIGDDNGGNTTLGFVNESTNGGLSLTANGSGQITLTGAATFNSGPTISATDSFIRMNDTDASADNQRLLLSASGEEFNVYVCTDAESCNSALEVTRTGNTIDTINLQATAAQANGAMIWTAGNDGSGSGLDADTLDGASSGGFVLNAGGAVSLYSAVSTTVTSRTSTTTNTCDANLAINVANATARYTVEAMLKLDGNGITANGYKVAIGGSGATLVHDWIATAAVNTTTANTSPTSNTEDNVGGGFTKTFALAGGNEVVHLVGSVDVTSPTAPQICVTWSQNTSNATATDLNTGSWLRLQRLN